MTSFQAMRVLMLGVLACGLLGAAPAKAEVNPLAELLRKVAAEEKEGGICDKVRWANGDDSKRYVRWLEAAVEGNAKVNKLKGGKQCQYDEVTRISYENGRKCVHYTWHSCLKGSTCASGTDVECKQSNGGWKRK